MSNLAGLTATYGVAAVYGIAEAAADGVAHITQMYAHSGLVAGVYRKRHLGEGEAAAAGAGIVFSCAAPGLYGPRRDSEADWRRGYEWWESSGRGDARRTGAWVALVTQAGSTVDEDFPGIAALVAPSGEVVARLPDWRPGLIVVDVPY